MYSRVRSLTTFAAIHDLDQPQQQLHSAVAVSSTQIPALMPELSQPSQLRTSTATPTASVPVNPHSKLR